MGTLAIMFGTMTWSHTMKVGDLVKTNKARIGVPVGTLGVIFGVAFAEYCEPSENGVYPTTIHYFKVMMFRNGRRINRRWLDIDLEPYNESG